MKTAFKYFCLFLVLLFVSCNTIKHTVVPITNPVSGKIAIFKPKHFKVNKNTRKSQRLALIEPASERFDEKWTQKHFGPLSPERKALVEIGTFFGFDEKDTNKRDGHFIAMALIHTQGIPQEDVDAKVPLIRKMIYRDLTKIARLK